MKIKEAMSTLKSRGWNIEIVWTLGYSEVEGNEVVDRLAKEAAVEAKDLEEEQVWLWSKTSKGMS